LDDKCWAVDFYNPSVQIELNSEYPLYTLQDLAAIRKGSPLTLDKEGTIPVIGPGAIRSLFIDPSSLDRTTEIRIPPKSVVTQANDVLIHAVGPYRGQAALVEPDLINYLVSRNVIVLQDISPKVLPAYLATVLNSGFVRKQMEDKSTGAVLAQLSIRKLVDIKIPVPDLTTQNHIVDKVSSTRRKLIETEQQALVVQSALKEQQESLRSLLDNIHLSGGANA
jgi:restriction endonuclease S subunit